MATRWVLVVVVVAAGFLLTACGDPQDAVHVGIGMQDNIFTREVTRIQPGDTIEFHNAGQTVHNALALDRAFTTEGQPGTSGRGLLDPGDRVRLTIDEPGVHEFYCTLHGTEDGEGMFAVLVVGDVEYQAAEEEAPDEPVQRWSGETLQVPQDHPTIQNAVDAAAPGDLVLIGPAPQDEAHRADDGAHVWKEQVEVTTPYLVLRGTDRTEVIIDGEFERPNGISVFAADGVAVENLTVRNATENGLFWTTLTGYRASYVTAYNNGVYGIYAFDAVDGLFEHSYAGGSPDAGFYIGQCEDCRALITDSIAENNALGYSGTNASGVHLVASTWRDNIVGIAPNTLDSELLPPFRDVTIVGNLVHDNDNRGAPALDLEWPTFGNGIMLAGGLDSVVERNLVLDHERSGILVTPNLSTNFWMTGGNRIRDNVVRRSGYADLTLSGPALGGNCFEANDVAVTAPAGLEAFAGCGGLRLPVRYDVASTLSSVGLAAEVGLGWRPSVDHRTLPPPEPQPNLPADAEVRPAYRVFAPFADAEDPNAMDPDLLASHPLPSPATEVGGDSGGAVTLAGVPLTLGAASAYFGIVGFLLPAVLLGALLILALIDLARREDLDPRRAAAWGVGVMAVPFVGAIAYLLTSAPPGARRVRITAILVGVLSWLVLLAAGAIIGGVV